METAEITAQNPYLHLVVFKLGDEEYGISIEQIKEVTVTPEITLIPHTSPHVQGIVNIRGEIIAVIDLKKRFKLHQSPISLPLGHKTYTLVVDINDISVGIIVDDVPQSLTIPVEHITKTPTLIQEVQFNPNYISGIGKIKNRLIVILDIQNILGHEDIIENKISL